jgi:hypothetical protein
MSALLEITTAGLSVCHEPEDVEAAETVAKAVEDTVDLLHTRWSLSTPIGCRIFVMTGWETFIRESAPMLFRPILVLSKPFWRTRVERIWDVAGGWMLPWGKRSAVGVKPPRLLERSDTRLGERLFVKIAQKTEKVRHLTCHELTHAFTHHLRLPPWLNEGVAMRAVDHLAGEATVLPETRSYVSGRSDILHPRAYRRLLKDGDEAVLRLYATGYWVTRYLDEGAGSALADVLRSRRSRRAHTRLARTTIRRLGDGSQ